MLLYHNNFKKNLGVADLYLIFCFTSISLINTDKRMEEGGSAFKILTDKPTGKRPLGKPRRRWENNIRMDLEKIGINAGN